MAPEGGNRFSVIELSGSGFEARKGRQDGVEWPRREGADNTLIGAEAVLRGLSRRRRRAAQRAGCCDAVKRLLLQPLSFQFSGFDPRTETFGRLGRHDLWWRFECAADTAERNNG